MIAILCPGPSLATVEEDWSTYELVVGVTDAILKPGVPFDVFCLQESCGHRHQMRCQRWGEAANGLEVWGLERVRDRWIRHWGIAPEKLKTDMPRSKSNSAIYAFWRASTMTDRVVIFGADMKGDTNYDPRTGDPIIRTQASGKLEPSKSEDWVSRWKTERKQFKELQVEAKTRGVELVQSSALARRSKSPSQKAGTTTDSLSPSPTPSSLTPPSPPGRRRKIRRSTKGSPTRTASARRIPTSGGSKGSQQDGR